MEISRQNYEPYFIDFLDGKLNDQQIGILLSFLEFNPDLKEEFSDIEKICLAPDETSFSGKARLIKSESDLTEALILKDFDMYCISSIENDIDDDDEEKLQGIIEDDPDREATYLLYQSTRLQPDKNILYPGKAKLKKRFIHIPYRIIIPAAAAVAALLIILRVFTGNGPDVGIQTVMDRAAENSQNEIQAREDAPLISSEAVNSETSDLQPKFNAGNQPVLANQSSPEVDPFTSRENIQLAMISSKSIDRVEGSITSPVQTGEAYHALRKNSSLAGSDRVASQSGDNPRLSLWILADASVRGLNSVSEDEYHLDREKDENGRTRRFTFDTPVFGISAPVRKPDKQR